MNQQRELQRQRSVSVDCGTPVSSSGPPVLDGTDGDKKQNIAEGGRSPKAPENTIPYTVVDSDTLAGIAIKFGSDPYVLKQINRLMSSMIYTGQVLHVPTAAYRPTSGVDAKKQIPAESKDTGAQQKKETKYSALRRFTSPSIPARKANEKRMDAKGKNRKNSGPKEAQSVDTFTVQASYLIGDKGGESLEGVLSITPEQFLFDPKPPSTEAEREIWEMVNYRMCLGDLLRSVKFYEDNPTNLDRVTTSTYLNALVEESCDQSHVTEGSPDSPPPHPHGSSGSSDSSMITFSASSAREKSTPPRTTISPSHTSDTSPLSTEVSPNSSGKKPTSSNTTTRDPGELSDGNSGENKNKTSDTVHKVHFVPDQEAMRASVIDATAAALASTVISEDVAADSVDAADTAAATGATYLRVKLSQKERPTVSSLVQSTFGALLMRPVTGKDLQSQSQSWTRHCFSIPIERTEDLKKFLTRYYSDKLSKGASDQKEKMERSISTDKIILRRNLSVLDVCRLPLPQMSEPSKLLTEVQIRILCEHLIVSADCHPWLLAFTTDKHGFSLKTLYRLCSQLDSASLLLVQDLNDQVFGAMLPCTIKMAESYYGSGDSFLFKFHPIFKKYGWAGKNDYFVSGIPASLSIGAGKSQVGLWMDDDLRRGRTGKCETYDNDPLSENSDFLIKAIEVWLFPIAL